MSGVNKAIIVGNLGRDPEMRYTQGGVPVTSLSIATTRNYTTKDGEKREETEWHRVTVWGPQAEHCNTYLAKGRQVYLEGRLQTRAYEDKEGTKRYSTEIVADTVQFLGSKPQASGGSQQPAERKTTKHPNKAPQAGGWPDGYTAPPPGDDDVPF